jgi:putative hydrolase of the HAD superfamily
MTRTGWPRAVIFDFYGTLARWQVSHVSNYVSVFAKHGYVLPHSVLDDYFARYDGVDHVDHSMNEETYEAWVRLRLRDLAEACDVPVGEYDVIIEALRVSDTGPMCAYPEAADTLRTLRDEGIGVGVCSNWGWHLQPYLADVDLLELVDSSVTSARAGVRKPHRSIYEQSARELGVDVSDAVFVGDSWVPDVEGPRRIGMEAVHLWRLDEREGMTPPPLTDGVNRIADLSELVELLSSMG